jgi:hypothetical protein
MKSMVQQTSSSGRKGADLATRLRVQRLLAAATLEPDGLPPAAVLLVRSLPDPLPGRLRPQRAAVRAPPDWERAVRTALTERLREAARPDRGVVSGDASSVLFADQAGLLAAFARDAAAGAAGRHWWWTALLRGLPGGDLARLAALWTREARYVPAALEHLSSWGQAERVLASVPVDQITRILAAVARAFEVSALLAVPASPPLRPTPIAEPRQASLADHDPTAPSGPSHGAADDGRGAATTTPLAPPWERLVTPTLVPRTLCPERQALLGAGLALHRAPLVARSPAFVAAFVHWRAAAAEVAAPRRSRPDPAPPAPERAVPDGDAPIAPRAFGRRDLLPTEAPPARPDLADSAARAEGGPAAEGTSSLAQSSTAEQPGDPGRGQTEHQRPAADLAARTGLGQWKLPSIEWEQTHSGLCGTFYLVNVVRALGFFRALDVHFRLPPVVGGWGWMELLARCLLSPSAASTADDPIWRLLDGLDGREQGVHVGSGFVGPKVESLPDTWARLLADAGESAPEPSPPLGMEPSSDLRWFLDLVVPFVRLRLEATLQAAGSDEPIETAMFSRVGLVQTTRSHVDVRMALDQVTLPVRLAGLDASPGWVPELGRVVTFHFQERTS